MTILLKLYHKLKILGRVFHLYLVPEEYHLVSAGLGVLGQEEQIEIYAQDTLAARPGLLKQLDEDITEKRTDEFYLLLV